MSLFEEQNFSSNGHTDQTAGPSSRADAPTAVLMGDGVSQYHPSLVGGSDPHRRAREIVRLIQCSICSLPLRNPLTLPCGNSLCRSCLPDLHTRTHISYPNTTNRQEGFNCPFSTCGKDHSLGDCSQDVTLAKVVERVSIEVARCRPMAADTPTLLDERPHWKNIVDSSKDSRAPSSRILNGGRLLATYTFAEIGELKFDSEVAYQTMSPSGDTYAHLDVAMLSHLKEQVKSELDCHVCYGLMLDPLTTTCGHTFCRKCVARVLDHSTLCPICRRDLAMPPGVAKVPGNQRLSRLLSELCPDLVAEREKAAALEEGAMVGEKNVPLFVCTLGFPNVPTFLHIFEPRYRLMVRRAIENGNRKFGMVMYNQSGAPQGDLGSTHFMLYGTLLHINNLQLISDGRSLLETMGVSRFKVKSSSTKDGYMVGDVERVDDISLAEEEQIEAAETTGPPVARNDLLGQLDRMSTQDLLKVGTDFITRMSAASCPWLHERVIAAYGPMPYDAALFPYWFASILPISDEEKYKLMPTTSVRQRLKITARWVRRIEAQRWEQQMGTATPVESSESEEDDENEHWNDEMIQPEAVDEPVSSQESEPDRDPEL